MRRELVTVSLTVPLIFEAVIGTTPHNSPLTQDRRTTFRLFRDGIVCLSIFLRSATEFDCVSMGRIRENRLEDVVFGLEIIRKEKRMKSRFYSCPNGCTSIAFLGPQLTRVPAFCLSSRLLAPFFDHCLERAPAVPLTHVVSARRCLAGRASLVSRCVKPACRRCFRGASFWRKMSGTAA